MSIQQLVVHIDRNAVRFLRVVDGISEESHLFHFKDKTDFGYKDQLETFLNEIGFRGMEWDEYSLSWFGPKTTLLPYTIFGETDAFKAFQLSFGNKVEENDVDFNRIPENMLVNIFEIPLWVKSFFIIRFPRMVLQHAGTHIIRGLFNESTFGLKILLAVHENDFLLAAVKNNELVYYNTIEFQSGEDILYHTAHLIQQNNWQNVKGQIVACAPLTDQSDALTKFAELHTQVDLFAQLKLAIDLSLMTNFQRLCV